MAVEVIEIKDANGVTQRVYVDKVGTDNDQVIKPGFGADDTLTLVSSTNGLPVNVVAGSASGTEYTEGATDTTITGIAILWEDTGDTLRAVSAANPLPAEIVAGAVALSGEDHIGSVGGHSPFIRGTVPTDLTPDYSIGDIVGGEIALTNAMRVLNGTGVLGSVTFADATNTKPELDLMFFESNPTATYSNNAAFPTGDADNGICLGIVTIPAADWKTFGTNAFVTVPLAGLGLYANATRTPYMVIVTRTVINFAAADDLKYAFSILQD